MSHPKGRAERRRAFWLKRKRMRKTFRYSWFLEGEALEDAVRKRSEHMHKDSRLIYEKSDPRDLGELVLGEQIEDLLP